jgi:hypothetical protein
MGLLKLPSTTHPDDKTSTNDDLFLFLFRHSRIANDSHAQA